MSTVAGGRLLAKLARCRSSVKFFSDSSVNVTAANASLAHANENVAVKASPEVPLLVRRTLQHKCLFNEQVTPPRQAWLENFDSIERKKLDIVELHPKIFAAFPRVDLINLNYIWQKTYRKVDWRFVRSTKEFDTGNKKPWPQKGTGRARHGSTRGPQWIEGGWAKGPRGPRTYFYMLPYFTRVRGLIATLSAKFAQNDLKIIDSLENFPSADKEYLIELIKKREWGPSVLIVDKGDIFPKNISIATDTINYINLMPVYGLNVHSMLKHETLIFTLSALEEIENKLLYQLVRTDLKEVIYKHKAPPIIDQEPTF